MQTDYDLIIVGGSVAGASSAIALAPEGYRILVLDRAVFPRDKPCGEGMMPQGVAVLERWGVLPEILSRGAVRVQGMRYCDQQGVWAQADFHRGGQPGTFGVVMRRLDLDHLLLRRAGSFANVTVRQGFRVTEVVQENQAVRGVAGHSLHSPARREVFHAPLTIGADGPRSIFHSACRLARASLPRKRFGVTGHLAWSGGSRSYVEVYLHPHGEIYVAPCGGDLSLVALLLEEKGMRLFRGDLRQRYRDFVASDPRLRGPASKSELVGPVFAVGPLGFTVDPVYRPGLLLAGDSAGFLDPITGMGMTLALKSVEAAVPLIREAFVTGKFGVELGQQYAEQRLRLVNDALRLTRLILALCRYKSIANRAVRRLSQDPALFRKLLGVLAGEHRYSDISLREKAALVLG